MSCSMTGSGSLAGSMRTALATTSGSRQMARAGNKPRTPLVEANGEFSVVFDRKLWIFGGKTGRANAAEEGLRATFGT